MAGHGQHRPLPAAGLQVVGGPHLPQQLGDGAGEDGLLLLLPGPQQGGAGEGSVTWGGPPVVGQSLALLTGRQEVARADVLAGTS